MKVGGAYSQRNVPSAAASALHAIRVEEEFSGGLYRAAKNTGGECLQGNSAVTALGLGCVSIPLL